MRALSTIEASAGTTIVPVTEAGERRACAILARYQDHLFSLADAVSFAVVDRLGLTAAFTSDGDFAAYGIAVIPPR